MTYSIFAAAQAIFMVIFYYVAIGYIWILKSLHIYLMNAVAAGTLEFPNVYTLPGAIFIVIYIGAVSVKSIFAAAPGYWKMTSPKRIRKAIDEESSELQKEI